MDTSDQYYRMCYEAFPEDREGGTVFKTQDQLQEMVRDESTAYGLESRFNNWLCSGEGWDFGFEKAALGKNPSMEQLWLAFVMKEKHNKIWNGEKWATNSN